MNLFAQTFSTPFGPFSIAVDSNDSLVATAFGDQKRLLERVRNGDLIEDKSSGRSAREQILAYFAGDQQEFDLALAPIGTSFQQRVWKALQSIPFGQTRSYGQLAAQLGNPGASRAVGRANATNPICLIVPCHRVIGADGSLTGFAFGEDIKRRLLDHESAAAKQVRAA
jgi:methylated-DNA-[protein]-cysteine S-methyltransferase